MHGIELIVFDFDGLILDTETPDYRAWQEIYAEHGQSLSFDRYAEGVGVRAGAVDYVGILNGLAGVALDRATTEARHRARLREILSRQPLRPGVRAHVDAGRRMGLRLAVASSATRAWVMGHLEQRGVLAAFEAVRTIEDVGQGKPAPDLYLAVLDALQVQPHAAVAYEDSPNGLLAARRAGMRTVAVPNPITERLDLSGADLRIPSLAETPLPELLARLDGTKRAARPQ